MKDLTRAFEEAAASAGRWSEDHLRQALHAVASWVPGSAIDWDDGAIQQWGLVISGDECLCMIRRDIPLAIMLPPAGADVDAALRVAGLVAVHAADWDGVAFRVDREARHSLSPDEVAWTEGYDGIDASAFSIWDLWWATA